MASTWINPSVVAKEVVRQVENNTVMGNLVFRGYEEEWQKKPNGYKPGSSITIKAPVYLRPKATAVMDAVDLLEKSLSLSLDFRYHIAYPVTLDEMTYNAEKNVPRFAKAAGQALGELIDRTLLGLYKYIPNQVGTPGVTPKDFLTLALANAKMSDHAAPTMDRNLVINPTAQAYIADALKNVYNPPTVGPAVERAKFATVAGLDCYVSQNVASHTCGTAAGLATVLVDDTVAEGDVSITIDTNGTWTLTLTEGDIFEVADVYGNNPISGVSTNQLRQFVCRSHTDDGNEGTISCIPGVSPWQIYSAAATEKFLPYQNMVALPANNAAVTVAGTAALVHPVNLAFHKDTFALAMVPLEIPDSVVWKARESHNGYVISVVKDFDVINYQEYIRFDILFAATAINPFLGCRLAG